MPTKLLWAKVIKNKKLIINENKKDIKNAYEKGIKNNLIQRLILNENKEIIKVIYIKNKLINFVVPNWWFVYVRSFFNELLIPLESINVDNIKNIEDIVYVIDDCGTGKIGINYTLESILAQANSHTIHHFASISFILHQLNIDYEIKGFGYNPSTPIPKRKGI